MKKTVLKSKKTSKWCVAWRDDNGETQWCRITASEPDPNAVHDHTACGHYVTLRIGSEMRDPTCEECLQKERTTSPKVTE